MAILYHKRQNKIKDSAIYNMWYAAVAVLHNVSTSELRDEIAHATAVTEADVTAVLMELARFINKHLINSESVKLDGLGTFYPRIRCVTCDKKEDVDSSKIQSVSVRFQPEKYKVGNVKLTKGKTKAVWQARLIKDYTLAAQDSTGDSSASSSSGTSNP